MATLPPLTPKPVQSTASDLVDHLLYGGKLAVALTVEVQLQSFTPPEDDNRSYSELVAVLRRDVAEFGTMLERLGLTRCITFTVNNTIHHDNEPF